jgi:hypothetical protein
MVRSGVKERYAESGRVIDGKKLGNELILPCVESRMTHEQYRVTMGSIDGCGRAMTELTRRLSVAELSQRILEMARTGVYRASIFDTFKPLATRRQISLAIQHAKKFGLHSVPSMRDADLGTYYQLDVTKFQALEQAFQKSTPIESEEDVLWRMTQVTATIQGMLAIAAGGAISLSGIGIVCLLTAKTQLGWGLLSSATGAVGIWVIQKSLAKKVL